MRPFTYLQPRDLDEALEQLDSYGADARPIAGGQSLLLELKARTRSVRALVALSRLPELRGCRVDGDGTVVLGPVTTYRELVAAGPPGAYRPLSTVVADIADVPVRSMATVGGAVCQADPRFDLPAVLLALGAEFVVGSTSGERRVSAETFVQDPGPARLAGNELLTALRLPPRADDFRWAFRKFRMRRIDAALVSIAVSGRLDGGHLRDPVVVAAGCLDRPTRLRTVERVLDGRPITDQLGADAGQALRAELDPPARGWPFFAPDYLAELGRVMVAEAVTDLATPISSHDPIGSRT
jgi:carbon-monoxide dehydrogenase medium subunit